MEGSMIQALVYGLAGLAVGGAVGWLVRQSSNGHRIDKLNADWQLKFDEAARQRDRFLTENNKLRGSLEAQQSLMHKHELAASRSRTELESARERMKSLEKDLFELGAIRDRLQGEVRNGQSIIAKLKHRVSDLEMEFEKAGDFYKGELAKAFEKRKTVEARLDDARAECDSLGNLLESAKSEYESVSRMLESAQTRLDGLDEIERGAMAFEAENAELKHDVARMKQEMEVLRRDLVEIDALKMQNRELSHCLKSMEGSRKQYEVDAKRYRDQAEHSEQLSDTLRMKLEDLERNLTEMANKQDEAEQYVAEEAVADDADTIVDEEQEIDDLTEIVGIGKVFQHTLHKLGIYSFRQLANFGPADIARVNAALKENKGRMEQDDWIGQARELYFQKYSNRVRALN